MTATHPPTRDELVHEQFALFAIKMDPDTSNEARDAITEQINLMTLAIVRTLKPRAEIAASAPTPYQRDILIETLDWMEGLHDLAPSQMWVNRSR